jgi:hypothetical protein
MTDTVDQADMRRLAARRVDAKCCLFIHALTYVAVNGVMTTSAALSGQFTQSILWSAGTWAVALLIHAIGVFADVPALRRRAIEIELVRLHASEHHE